MKKIFISLVIIATLSSAKVEKTEFSREALSEKLVALDENRVEFGKILNENKGKVVLIEIWASWCSDCVKAMPKLKELQAVNPEVNYVFVSMDKTMEKWREGIAKHQLNGAQYLAPDGMKGAFGKAIDLDWIPRYIIIDKTGKIVIYRAIETDFNKINDTLKQLTNEK